MPCACTSGLLQPTAGFLAFHTSVVSRGICSTFNVQEAVGPHWKSHISSELHEPGACQSILRSVHLLFAVPPRV